MRDERVVTSIVLAGVGGQGSVLSTGILAEAAVRAGHEVVTSEVHGMSQRGGTVVTSVRYGGTQLAPAVPEGAADVLVAFELLEAARHLHLVRPRGLALVGDQRIAPAIESLKTADYPRDLHPLAEARGVHLQLVPTLRLAREELSEPKLAGVVLLGALSNFLDLPLEAWRGAIAETVPPRWVAANLSAFFLGEEWGVGPATAAF